MQHSITLNSQVFCFTLLFLFFFNGLCLHTQLCSLPFLWPLCLLSVIFFFHIPRGPEIALNINVIMLDVVVSFHRVFFAVKCAAEHKISENDSAAKN